MRTTIRKEYFPKIASVTVDNEKKGIVLDRDLCFGSLGPLVLGWWGQVEAGSPRKLALGLFFLPVGFGLGNWVGGGGQKWWRP